MRVQTYRVLQLRQTYRGLQLRQINHHGLQLWQTTYSLGLRLWQIATQFDLEACYYGRVAGLTRKAERSVCAALATSNASGSWRYS